MLFYITKSDVVVYYVHLQPTLSLRFRATGTVPFLILSTTTLKWLFTAVTAILTLQMRNGGNYLLKAAYEMVAKARFESGLPDLKLSAPVITINSILMDLYDTQEGW